MLWSLTLVSHTQSQVSHTYSTESVILNRSYDIAPVGHIKIALIRPYLEQTTFEAHFYFYVHYLAHKEAKFL